MRNSKQERAAGRERRCVCVCMSRAGQGRAESELEVVVTVCGRLAVPDGPNTSLSAFDSVECD